MKINGFVAGEAPPVIDGTARVRRFCVRARETCSDSHQRRIAPAGEAFGARFYFTDQSMAASSILRPFAFMNMSGTRCAPMKKCRRLAGAGLLIIIFPFS